MTIQRAILTDVRGATFSPCRTWRYTLWREWDADKPTVAFIGLNPSTADETSDDPTMRRCIAFAKAWGFGRFVMLNLFAFRSTDPKGLRRVPDPIGPENDDWIYTMVDEVQLIVVAWGAHSHPMMKSRAEHVLSLIPIPKCLGTTKGGSPRHPLYVPGNTKLVEYRPE